MSDLETRLRRALEAVAGSAPEAGGLVEGARGRLRRRRERLVAGVAAVVVLGVVAPLIAIAAGRSPDGSVALGAPGGLAGPAWRTESWHDLTLQVPASWQYGEWNGCGSTPVVSKPDQASDLMLCSPQRADEGVEFGAFLDDRGVPPKTDVMSTFDGITQVVVGGDGFYVAIADKDAALVRTIWGTVRHLGTARDSNGCYAKQVYIPKDAETSGDISVCDYDADGNLELSERLAGEDAAAAMGALDATHEPGLTKCRLRSSDWMDGQIVLVTQPGVITVDPRSCPGITGALGSREISADVLYWAIPPGWGGGWQPQDLPFPKTLRSLAPAPTPVTPSTTTGTRTESYHDLTLQVPSSWAYGCPSPAVWRGTSARSTGLTSCQPQPSGTPIPAVVTGAGADLGPARDVSALHLVSGRVYEPAAGSGPGDLDGAGPQPRYLGVWFDKSTFIEVRDDDRTVVQQILDSIHPLGDVPDANGCYSQEKLIPAGVTSTAVSICAYDEQGRLLQSERLDAADSASAMAALQAAPEIPESQGVCLIGYAGPRWDWISPDGLVSIIPTASCAPAIEVTAPSGVMSIRSGTADVAYWTETPGSPITVPEGFPAPRSGAIRSAALACRTDRPPPARRAVSAPRAHTRAAG